MVLDRIASLDFVGGSCQPARQLRLREDRKA